MPGEQGARERRPQIEAFRQRRERRAVDVEADAARSRVGRLRSDLQVAAEVPGESLDVPAANEARKLFPIRAQHRLVVGLQSIEQRLTDAPLADRDRALPSPGIQSTFDSCRRTAVEPSLDQFR